MCVALDKLFVLITRRALNSLAKVGIPKSQRDAVCCSVLQCVQCVAVRYTVLHCVALHKFSVLNTRCVGHIEVRGKIDIPQRLQCS